MEKDFEKIINKIKNERLSVDEKSKMRENLELFIKEHPVRNPHETRLISQERLKWPFPNPFLLNIRLKNMTIALVIALLIGGGTSFAAERSLPGDTLYPIKVNVNEEVRSFLAVGSEAQANWDAERAERRLEELEKLSADGNLSAQIKAEVEADLSTHIQSFEREKEKLEAKSDTEAAVKVQSNLETKLREHEAVLIETDGALDVQIDLPLKINTSSKTEVEGSAGQNLSTTTSEINAETEVNVEVEKTLDNIKVDLGL